VSDDEQTPLSGREMEIVQLLATGATNQQIALELGISTNTVKVHLRNIYGKLDVASRTEATMLAVREGWLGVPGAAEEGPEPAPPVSPLPELEAPLPVSLAKRLSLLLVLLLTAALLFLPPILEGQANNQETNPIDVVFPTAVSGPPTDRWRTRAQMPTPRNGLAVAAHGGLIFAIGGVSNEGVTGKVEVYDPATDAWSGRSSKPTPVGFCSAAVVGDKIYVPGGIDAGRQVRSVLEVYDPATDSWARGASLPFPLGAYGLAVFDDHIYLFGGLGDQGYTASVLRYDPQAGEWETLAPMDKPRGFLGAAAVGERIYVAGGFDDEREFDALDAFDPGSGAWTSLAPMGQRRGGLALIAVRDYLYAIGGGMTTYLAFNERYDPRVDLWSRIETPVEEQWRGLGAAFIHPNIYAIGGWNGGNLSANESYQALFQILVPVGP